MITLAEQIKQTALNFAPEHPEASSRFLNRLKESPLLTREENYPSHFCVYFLPFNPNTKQVFLVHHKKANLWISPGGHIDKGELLLDTLNREIKEELGVQNFFPQLPKPFLISVTPINNPLQPCTEHLDVWFLLNTDGANFKVDPEEFYQVRWMPLIEAQKIVTDPANLAALNIINKID